MRPKNLGMTKLLFDTLENIMKYKFTQSIWSKNPDITEVLLNTKIDVSKYYFPKACGPKSQA